MFLKIPKIFIDERHPPDIGFQAHQSIKNIFRIFVDLNEMDEVVKNC